jgi:hypothetical protein
MGNRISKGKGYPALKWRTYNMGPEKMLVPDYGYIALEKLLRAADDDGVNRAVWPDFSLVEKAETHIEVAD